MPLVNRKLNPPRIHYKAKWSDSSWTELTGAEPLEVIDAAASHDTAGFSFRYRYGEVMRQGESQFKPVAPLSILNYWIRVQYNYGTAGDPNWTTIFLGQVYEENRDARARETSGDIANGIQTFACYGPYELLRRRSVSRSFWRTTIGLEEIKWIPPMNSVDHRNVIVGNKSTGIDAGNVFVYSTDGATWSSRDYGEYVLEKFMNSADVDDPPWLFGGAPITLTQDLANYKNSIEFGDGMSVADILHAIIPKSAGFDWFIKYGGTENAETFEVYVFSLASEDINSGDAQLHKNPNEARFNAVANLDLQVAKFSRSSSTTYSKIRLVGARAVVCASFEQVSSTAGEIEDGWTTQTELEYEAGTGDSSDDAETHDAYRATDRFRDVYQKFRVIDAANFDASRIPSVTRFGRESFTVRGASQDLSKETLSWLPLKQGWRYNEDPPYDTNDARTDPPFLPPMVFLQKAGTVGASSPYVFAEFAGAGVSPLPTEWGVQLHASPNHKIAGGDFTATNPTQFEAEYSSSFIAMTIAWRSDERLTVERELTSSPNPGNAEGVYEIPVPDAEIWLLCPNTIVDLDDNGNPIRSPSSGVVLRSDKDRLDQMLVGAIARYQNDRFRASITVHGIWDWAEGLGYLLVFDDDGASTSEVAAPITFIRWNFDGDHTTQLKTGFAL